MEACIKWNGAINSSGYPVTWHNNKTAYAHRVIMNAGDSDVVMHICDNKECVNPNHLRIGTPKENSLDMVSKGRQAKGEACGNAKLTEGQVREIRMSPLSSRKLAKLYNISKTNVLDIKKLKIWRHL
jgi:hypothetical protein